MYNLFDNCNDDDIKNFKERLSLSRKNKSLTQEDLADKFNITRGSIANWENFKSKSNIFPTLPTFTKICSVLDVDPNYLLGVSEIRSQNDDEISKATGLSIENIKLLKENKYCNGLIDYFLSSDEASNIIEMIKKICYFGYISQTLETSFSENICNIINKAFTKFSEDIFVLDMSQDKFIDYLKKEIELKSINNIDSFIKESIQESEYDNITKSIYSDFNSLAKEEKYNTLIELIADYSYEYKMSSSIIELSKHKISISIFNILDKYIEAKVTEFKKGK